MTKPVQLKAGIPSSDQAKRVAGIMKRRLETAWSEREVRAFRRLLPINEDDLCSVERMYKYLWPPDRDKNILRHNLITFLNNFQGEIDKANVWIEKRAKLHKPMPRKIIPMPVQPEQAMTDAERAEASASFERLMGRKPNI